MAEASVRERGELGEDADESGRLLVGQGPEEHRVDDAENCRRSADAKCQASDGRGRKSRILGEKTKRVADVLHRHPRMDFRRKAAILVPGRLSLVLTDNDDGDAEIAALHAEDDVPLAFLAD